MTDVVAAPVVTAFGGHQHVWRHVERVGWFCWLCPSFQASEPRPQVFVDPYELAEAQQEHRLDQLLAHAPTGGGRTRERRSS